MNAARFLPRCLESVARAALVMPTGAIEHIVMDGGSTDGSVDLIRAHAQAHPALVTHWRSQRDGGQSAAINAGFARAKGAFGAWLNADDWFEMEDRTNTPALVRIVRELERQGDSVDVLLARARIVDERGRTIWAPVPSDPMTLAELLRVRSRWYAGRGFLQPEAFMRLEAFRSAGGLIEASEHCMDYELWLELAGRGARFAHLDVLVASQLAHAQQKTANRVETLRAVSRMADRAFAAHRSLLGSEAREIEQELDAVRRKLRIADAALPMWAGRAAPALSRPSAWKKAVSEVLARARKAMLPAGARPRALAHGLDEEELAAVRAALDSCELFTTPSEGGDRFDLALCGAGARGAADALRTAALGLRSGGALVLLPVPRRSTELDAYLAWLGNTLTGNLAANHDQLADRRVDGDLEAWLSRCERSKGSAGAPLGAGLADSELAHATEGLRRIALLEFGAPEDHPLTPFRFIGPGSMRPRATWICGAWRRE